MIILVLSIIPLESVSAKTPTNKEINSYSSEVAELIKEKCHGDCENVVIVGDDYVVPHFRRDIRLSPWYNFLIDFGGVKNDEILTDIGYVQRKQKTFSEFDDLFKLKYDDKEYQGKDVVIIRPTNPTSRQNSEINEFKQVLVDNGYNPNFIEKKGDEIVCNDVHLWDNFNGDTLFVFGTEENNPAFNCFPFQAGLENRDAAFIDINPWDGRNYAVIVNTNDPNVIEGFTNLIKSKGYVNLSSSSAYFFNVHTDTAGYLVLGVAAVALIVGTGGAAAPAVVVAAWGVTEVAVDGADIVNTCVVNPDGAGWCAGTVALAVLPGAVGPTKKAMKKLADDDIVKGLKNFDGLFKSHRKNIQNFFGDDVLKKIIKNADDEISLVKGAEMILKNVPGGNLGNTGIAFLKEADGAEALKNLGKMENIPGVNTGTNSIVQRLSISNYGNAKGAAGELKHAAERMEDMEVLGVGVKKTVDGVKGEIDVFSKYPGTNTGLIEEVKNWNQNSIKLDSLKESIDNLANLNGKIIEGVTITNTNLVLRNDVIIPSDLVTYASSKRVSIITFGGVD
jgi:hypothetical protein